jgi:phage shock protein C
MEPEFAPNDPAPNDSAPNDSAPNDSAERSLRRSFDGRMVAGVAAGAARYLGTDVTVVRIGLVALTLLGGIGVPLYVAAWLLVPDEDADESVAEHFMGGHRIEVTRRQTVHDHFERSAHGVSA